MQFTISYTGGDGNDVVLSHGNTAPTNLSFTIAPTTINEGQSVTLSNGTFTDPDTTQTHTVTINWGDGSANDSISLAAGVTTFGPISHTFLEERAIPFTVTVTVTDAAGGTVSGTQNVTVNDAPLTASTTANPQSAVEGASTGDRIVGSFTDADPNGTATDYTATIAWGDSTTSTASGAAGSIVANASGGFDVHGTHTYLEEGTFVVTVAVTDVGTATTTITNTTFTVADAPLSSTGTLVSAVEGASTGAVAVANFNDADPNGTATDYTATINWGDGTAATTGTVAANGSGGFTVRGTHTYAEEGTNTITVTIQDAGGSTTTATSTANVADAPLSAVGQSISAVEGQPILSNHLVDMVDADPMGISTDYTGTINWGDGTSSPAQFFPQPVAIPAPGAFVVTGSHTYAEEGTYTVTTTITDVGGSSTVATAIATVTDAALTPSTTANPQTAVEGASTGDRVVGSFTDNNPNATAGEFTASITWGDKATTGNNDVTGGTVVRNGTTAGGLPIFDVHGTFTYAEEGKFNVTVNVTDIGTSTTTISNTTFTVSDAALASAGVPVSGVEGASTGNVPVATFSDAGGPEPIANYTVTINWGDSTPLDTTTGKVTVSGTTFTASGTHTYAEENIGHKGPYTVTVVIKDEGGSTTTATTVANVTDAPLTASTTPNALSGNEGSPVANQIVGSFTDANPGEPVSDFTAVINWGDGTALDTTSGKVEASGNAATFNVRGTHTYFNTPNHTNTFNVTTTVTDEGGSTVVIKNTTVTVTNVGPTITEIDNSYILANAGTGAVLFVNNQPVPVLQTMNGIVVTQIDEGTSFTLTIKYDDPGKDAQFATVDWGDGTTADNNIALPPIPQNGPGVFSFSHTYQHGINHVVPVTVFLKDAAGDFVGSWSPQIGQPGKPAGVPFYFIVHDRVVVTPSNQITVNATSNGTFVIAPQVLGTFFDRGVPEAVSNYVVIISWGDGTFNTSTDGTGTVQVVATPSGTFQIVGSHVSQSAGTFTLGIAVVELTTGEAFTALTPLLLNGQGQSFLLRIFQDEALNAFNSGKLLYNAGTPFNTSCDGTYPNALPVEGDVFTTVISSNASKLNVGADDPNTLNALRANVVQVTLGSQQFLIRVVRSLYCELFGADILKHDAAGNALLTTDAQTGKPIVDFAIPEAKQWVEFLAQNGSMDQLKIFLMSSNTFVNNVAHNNVKTYIDLLFEHFMNRVASASEEQGFSQALAGGASLADVATTVASSSEAHAFLVNNLFMNFLKRMPSPQELAFFQNALNAGTITENQIVFDLVTTTEYFNLGPTGQR